MASIVDKYFSKKKKDLVDYSMFLYDLINFNGKNDIFVSDIEFCDLVKASINEYVDNYFFQVMEDFDDYEEYFGNLKKCDNKFKTILVCTINAIDEELANKSNKIPIYIASLTIYMSVMLNRFTYPYVNYKINVKNISTIIDMIVKNISFVSIKDDMSTKKALVSLLKKNSTVESKLFQELNSLNNDMSKNLYITIDYEKRYYLVRYKYSIPELRKYRVREVNKCFKKIGDNLNILSYELALITMLKAKTLGKNIILLFPINLSFYKKELEVNRLSKVITNEYIKKSIYLYADYSDYDKNREVYRILANAGFKLALNFSREKDVPYRTFNEIKLATVTNEFIKDNEGNMTSWIENGVNFVIKDEVVSEYEESKVLGLEGK